MNTGQYFIAMLANVLIALSIPFFINSFPYKSFVNTRSECQMLSDIF